MVLLSIALLCFQSSLLARPLYLDEAPPELRSARHLLLAYKGARIPPTGQSRTREQAEELGIELLRRAHAGEDFLQLAREYSDSPNAKEGGVLGTFAPGMLEPHLDEFLFAATTGAVSDMIETPAGWTILQRIETEAGVLQIQIDVKDPGGRGASPCARCAQVVGKLSSGGDFAELAKEFSDDAESRARGGQFAIYERGPRDKLLKSAAFELSIGEVSQPIRSPLGYHILKRVAPGPSIRSCARTRWVRLRAILVQYDLAQGADMAHAPDQKKARQIADALAVRLHAGEDMLEVAAEFNDDPGGKKRRGDLGWIHRGAPNITPMLQQAALLPIGQIGDPLLTPFGYLLVRRER
ncbi:MAG: peptidylprolyl isomerase [Planctomycetes bacterium]|nr:peptidylprolyl isomerase [Planctomycetota bacterium]